jgi:hypothetical protein
MLNYIKKFFVSGVIVPIKVVEKKRMIDLIDYIDRRGNYSPEDYETDIRRAYTMPERAYIKLNDISTLSMEGQIEKNEELYLLWLYENQPKEEKCGWFSCVNSTPYREKLNAEVYVATKCGNIKRLKELVWLGHPVFADWTNYKETAVRNGHEDVALFFHTRGVWPK